MWTRALTVSEDAWTELGYLTLGLGVLAAVASALLAVRTRARQTGSRQDLVVADVRATLSQLAEPVPASAVPPQLPQLVQWEQHAAEVARRQLDLYLRHSTAALRQSNTSFVLGMSAATLGFLAILGSLGWLLTTDKDVGWLGVISGAVCEAVAALFFGQMRVTRARTHAMFERAQADAERVVRARSALAVVQSINDPAIREALLADIGRLLLDDPLAADQRTGGRR